MYFDARAAKSLQADNHIVIDGCPGLRLVATATRKTWIYRFKSPATGLMKQLKIGAWPEMPPATAAAKWQELRARRDGGEDLIADKKIKAVAAKVNPDGSYRLGQLVADYSKGYLHKMRQPRGAIAVERRLYAAIDQHKHFPVASVDRRFVFDLIESLSSAPTIAKTVKTEMKAAFEYALNSGRIDGDLPNWWALVKVKLKSKGAMRDGKRKGTTKRILTNAEIKALVLTDLQIFKEQVRDFLTIQLWTCTRGNEIVNMEPRHFTHEADGVWWTVPRELTKNRDDESATDLRVPVIGRALEIVNRRMLTGSDWLFTKTSKSGVVGPQDQGHMSTLANYHQPFSKTQPTRMRKRLTVSHWSPHDLRRTGRTLLASMGCPDEIGEAIIGHKKPGVLGVYNLYKYDKERRHWLTLLDAKLESIISTV